MSIAEQAIVQLVRAINIWLAATGHAARVQPSDIVVTTMERDGQSALVLAFRVAQSAPRPPYSTMGEQRR